MKFLLILLFAIVFKDSSAVTLEKVEDYFDEVLLNLIQAVEDAGLTLHELPNFTHNLQNRSPDGTVANAKVHYHSGNLTGLDGTYRQECNNPIWVSGNITAQCKIGIEQIDVKYQAKFQNITGYNNNVHFRHFDFGISGFILNTDASLEITSSPHIMVPTIKNFQITKFGDLEFTFHTTGEISYEQVMPHLHSKIRDMVYDLFAGPYKEAFEMAVESVKFPEEH